ncbi:MAG: DUF4249 domain-containing protein [Bacteroides sp.]|jgi:hypothetical protein|nr:DUF4249 domain-containing protein [Bacteroides sp.]
MKKINIALWILLSGVLFFSACQEEYRATLDNTEPLLVVEGLITDQPGPHTVKLTRTVKFQEVFAPEKVLDASVKITGTDGTVVFLQENQPGVYQTPPDFSGVIGESYVLYITTSQGEEYQSAPQEIIPPLTIDSVFGQLGQEVFYHHSNISDNVYISAIDGTNTFLQTSGGVEQTARYRFISDLYLQYIIVYQFGMAAETYDYCWVKRTINEQLGTDIGNPNSLPQATDKVGFVIRNRNDFVYYGINAQLYDMHRVMINKIFTLNEDSYLFHKAKNEQLGDEGRFFDPIASQLPGNIQCTSDSSQEVLGLFEASSEFVMTYKVIADFFENNVTIEFIGNLDTIPRSGCLYEQFPDHWLFP